MYHLSIIRLCQVVLWLGVIALFINCGSVSSQSFSHQNDRSHHHREHGNLHGNQHQNRPIERHDRQNFPFVNNPGQKILERIRENLGTNLGKLGNSNNMNFGQNIGGQALQNTYSILNKTFANLNQLAMGNFGNIRQPNFPNNGGSTSVPVTPQQPNFPINNGDSSVPIAPVHPRYTTPKRPNIDQSTIATPQEGNIAHYIDGKFPVILLKDNEVRK